MKEIKVGEYCRTEEGYIGKLIEYIPNALNYLKIDVGREIRHCDNSVDNFIYTRYGFQIKHSSNIIDLIEVGEYVNGKLITDIDSYEIDNKKIKYLIYDKKSIKCGNYLAGAFYKENIKDIVTKEMFNQVKYEV